MAPSRPDEAARPGPELKSITNEQQAATTSDSLQPTDKDRVRYSVTLNAPTALTPNTKGLPVSYVDQNTVYNLSILDTGSSCDETHEYHTVIRVCSEDDQLHQSSRAFSPSRKPTKDGLYTIEYATESQTHSRPSPVPPTLHSCFRDSFSVTWSSNSITGGSYCVIPIKLHTAGTQETANLKLYVGTERIRAVDAGVSVAELYQESFARLKLFTRKGAQAFREKEILEIQESIAAHQRALEKTNELATDKTDQRVNGRGSEPRNSLKRKAIEVNQVARQRDAKVAELNSRLSLAREALLSSRPVQVFRSVTVGDGEKQPFHVPSEQTKSSKVTIKTKRERRKTKLASNSSTSKPNRIAPSTTTSAQVPVARTLQGQPQWMAASPKCFYIRPEHQPDTRYRAIYLMDKTYRDLLMSISCKFGVAVAEIGLIYFYDQAMTPIVVDEASIAKLREEQDLIVQFPYAMYSAAEASLQSGGNRITGINPEIDFDTVYGPGSNQSLQDSSKMFYQYLSPTASLSREDYFGESGDSWSEITGGMSPITPFIQSSTGQASMSSEEMYLDATYAFNHFALGTDTVAQMNSHFDGSNFTFHRSSAPGSVYSLTSEGASIISTASGGTLHTPITQFTDGHRIKSFENVAESSKIIPDAQSAAGENHQLYVAAALERNRLAAAKCRTTRKEKEQRLVKDSEEKAEQNAKLKKEVMELEAEVKAVREMLAAHNTCD